MPATPALSFRLGSRLSYPSKRRSEPENSVAIEGRQDTVARNHKVDTGLIDRRTFMVRAGLLAAGSAFGGSVVGCSSEFVIPSLGPAAAPTPVPGITYIRASEIGCALDCSLENGRNKKTGGTATDDGPRINAAMAGASAENPITLIIDGSALISGLFLPAGGYWGIVGLGDGTGFFVKTGTNNDGIHNGRPDAGIPSDPGPPAPARGANVSLKNFTLNGNQGNGHNGDSTTGLKQGTKQVWYCGINLMNIENITLEKVVIVNTPAYHVRLSNVGHVSASGCVLKSKGLRTDGLHFDGPANDIDISHCDFTLGDDAIALNCPEGYTGSISNITVTNCTFKSSTMMRLYATFDSSSRTTIDNVTVKNCSGTVFVAGFSLCDGSGGSPEAIKSLTVSDSNLKAPAVLDISANFGNVLLKNVTLVPYDSNNPPGLAFVRSSALFFGRQTYVGSSLAFENCSILKGGGFDVAALIIENNSSIANLAFNGFATQGKELLNILSGSLGNLVLNSVDITHTMAPVSSNGFASIGSVSGTGVLATAWEFPDAVMANGVPFISAESHLPSIKVNNVTETYRP